jgi:DNA-binding beta-propeller fold protein YncE
MRSRVACAKLRTMIGKAIFSGLVLAGALLASAASAAPALRAEKPIEIAAAPQRFDLMTVDVARRRLLAAHSGAGTLAIVNLTTKKLLREVPVGHAAGVAVDARDGKYFVGTQEGVAVIDRNSLKKTGMIATPGPADALLFDRRNDRLYATHDDGTELWVIDARHDRRIGSIALPGAPELMALDPQTYRLYLAIKSRDAVVAIAPSTGKITAQWPTAPTASPHGVAVDLKDRLLFVAGHGGTLAVFALPTGRKLPNVALGGGPVDQIAFDALARRLYCPAHGSLVAVKVSAAGESVIGSIAIPKTAHSVAIDPRTHLVWIAYADNGHAYVQAFAPPPEAKSVFKRH